MAISDFLSRHGVTLDHERLRSMQRQYVEGLPSKEMIVAGVEELVEVGASAAAIGALEQRYGEQKMTLFMKDQTDSSGNPVKDADGNVQKVSGTGLPMSAAGAILGVLASAFVPMKPAWRRRVMNVTTGLGAAFMYRKGIDWGQQWLDSASKTSPATAAPRPPFGQSSAAQGEIASVKGELNPGGTVVSLQDVVRQQEALIERQRANGGR